MNMRSYLREIFDVNENMTENNEIFSDCDALFDGDYHTIGVKAIIGDFGPEELADVVDIAEKLYFSTEKPVILCLAMDRHCRILVKEMSIKSEADFSIKLAHLDMYEVALDVIRKKIEEGTADQVDIKVLAGLPMTVARENRKKVRIECFKLISEIEASLR